LELVFAYCNIIIFHNKTPWLWDPSIKFFAKKNYRISCTILSKTPLVLFGCKKATNLLSAPFLGISFKTINPSFLNDLFPILYLQHQKQCDGFLRLFWNEFSDGLSGLWLQEVQFVWTAHKKCSFDSFAATSSCL